MRIDSHTRLTPTTAVKLDTGTDSFEPGNSGSTQASQHGRRPGQGNSTGSSSEGADAVPHHKSPTDRTDGTATTEDPSSQGDGTASQSGRSHGSRSNGNDMWSRFMQLVRMLFQQFFAQFGGGSSTGGTDMGESTGGGTVNPSQAATEG